jgi:hypothetical protein
MTEPRQEVGAAAAGCGGGGAAALHHQSTTARFMRSSAPRPQPLLQSPQRRHRLARPRARVHQRASLRAPARRPSTPPSGQQLRASPRPGHDPINASNLTVPLHYCQVVSYLSATIAWWVRLLRFVAS